MRRIRVIPNLLIQNGGLVKSVRFKNPTYIGDPINAVRIFNEKEVDELCILDISASRDKRPPNLAQISEIASEAFMPLAYGGGIRTIAQIKAILFEGVEKVVINTSALDQPDLIREAANRFGNQSIVVSIDVKKDWFGNYKVFRDNGEKNTGLDPEKFAFKVAELGAGEILLTNIERDGTFTGFDLEMIKRVSRSVDIPVIAAGGAASISDFLEAVQKAGASAVAAGSMFVYQGLHRAVLINYPHQQTLRTKLYDFL